VLRTIPVLLLGVFAAELVLAQPRERERPRNQFFWKHSKTLQMSMVIEVEIIILLVPV